jgi:hypothetical protein
MAETVNGLVFTATLRGSVVGADGTIMTVDKTYTATFTDGTGASQIGYIFQKNAYPLNATSKVFDMDGETDFQGAAMSSNNNVKLIWAENKDTTSGHTLTMGGDDLAGSSGPLVDSTDLMRTGAAGIMIWVSPTDGAGITASTADGLKFAMSGNSTMDLVVAGDNT